MKRQYLWVTFIYLLAFSLFPHIANCSDKDLFPLAGEWRGVAKAIQGNVQNPTISFSILVSKNGGVSGRIGSLKINSGEIDKTGKGLKRIIRKGDVLFLMEVEGEVSGSSSSQKFAYILWLGKRDGQFEGEIYGKGIDSKTKNIEAITYRILSWDKFQ